MVTVLDKNGSKNLRKVTKRKNIGECTDKTKEKKFDLGDPKTYDLDECPVGPYLKGKTFEEIYNILTKNKLQKDLPVCKKADGTPDPQCIQVLYRTIVLKDVVNIANVTISSHEHVLEHTDTHPPLSKKQLRKRDKSIFDSSQDQYDLRTNQRERVLYTIFKVHKDCETAGTDKAEIKYSHLKIYDKQGVFRLSKFCYGFEYDYAHQLGCFSQQTSKSGPFGCTEDNFTLF